MRSRKNHFPDWLFYLLSCIIVLSISGAINFHGETSSLSKSLSEKKDSLLTLNKTFIQGKLISIVNHDKTAWHINQMTVIYRNKFDSLVVFEKLIDKDIEPQKDISFSGNEFLGWDNSCLFYCFDMENENYKRLWLKPFGTQMIGDKLIINSK